MRAWFALLTTCLFVMPTAAKYSGGSGTADDPYQIATAADLIALGETPADCDKHFILTADIDLDPNLPGRRVFDRALIAPDTDPVKNDFQGAGFTGVFDGKGHVLSHLTVRGGSYVGLFGRLAAGVTVRNLGVVDANVIGTRYVGALAGSNSGQVTECYSTGRLTGVGAGGALTTVGGLLGENISAGAGQPVGSVVRCHSTAVVRGEDDVGGLVGLSRGSPVSECYTTGAVGGKASVGGLIGQNYANVTRCYSTGSVSSTGQNVGGLVGGNSYGTVRDCWTTGAVNGNGSVGGLVGYNGSTVTECHSAGAVSGTSSVGGLVGQNYGDVTQCHSAGTVRGQEAIGGLVGYNAFFWPLRGHVAESYSSSSVSGESGVGGLAGVNVTDITRCCSVGLVSGNWRVGGLVGSCENAFLGWGVATACFWDTQTSGQAISAGGTGKTTAEMRTAKTFLGAGWDFAGETANGTEDIWWIIEGKDYPRLRWERAGKYGGGTGEPNDPYLIFTAGQMNAIGTEPNDWGKHFKVMVDIDLSAYDGKAGRPAFNIIAPDTDPSRDYFQGMAFAGVFDGGQHKLSHLTIKGISYLGLFGQLAAGAQVREVWIEDVNVTGAGDCIAALAATNRGSIIHCCSTGVVNATGKAQERAYSVGGLIASNFGDVKFCHSVAAVNGGTYVGGFAGDNWGTIARCYAGGSVQGGGSVGGFAGENYGAVTRCYSLGPVAGESYVGGLVGENYQGQVTDCYSTGAVSGGWYVGGLVGQNGALTDAGKLAAVSRCYSAGPVKGQSIVGGLVGSNLAAVTGSFWDRQTSGQTTSAGGTSKTTAELQAGGTFLTAGWDFVGETANGTEDIWEIREGKDYPRLRWEPAVER